jgi:hypothetical protein
MTRSEFIAEILIELKLCASLSNAKTAIEEAFKTEFPYWNFADGNQPVNEMVLKSMRFRAMVLKCENLNKLIAEFHTIEQLMYPD